jgi:hypothetical protein
MFATVERNDTAQPHNRDAWKIVVVDDETSVWGDVIYDHTLLRDVPLEEQLVARLGPYTALARDVVRTEYGYRIDNVRPR